MYGFLNINNQVEIKPEFTPAENFSERLSLVGKCTGMDEDYNEIIKYGFIDKSGKVVINFQYNFATSFKNGVSKVEKNNSNFYIDKQGNRIPEEKAKLIEIKEKTKNYPYPIKFLNIQKVNGGAIETYGYKDKIGNTLIRPIYTEASEFKNGLAMVSVNHNYFYILPNGEELVHRKIQIG